MFWFFIQPDVISLSDEDVTIYPGAPWQTATPGESILIYYNSLSVFSFQIWLTKLTAALTSQIPGISLGVNVFLSIILRSYRFIFSPDGTLAGVETDHTETTTAVATIIIKPGNQISPQKVNKIICQVDHVRFLTTELTLTACINI